MALTFSEQQAAICRQKIEEMASKEYKGVQREKERNQKKSDYDREYYRKRKKKNPEQNKEKKKTLRKDREKTTRIYNNCILQKNLCQGMT